jgi:hypothetical protein
MNHGIAHFNPHQRRPLIPLFEEFTVILCEVDLQGGGALDNHAVGAVGDTDVYDVQLLDVHIVHGDV